MDNDREIRQLEVLLKKLKRLRKELSNKELFIAMGYVQQEINILKETIDMKKRLK